MKISNFTKGLISTSAGSFFWGFIGTIYFQYISFIGFWEVVVHRSIWTLVILIITTTFFNKWKIFKIILIDKKKILIPLPLIIAKINVALLEKFPNPLITMDQLKLLKYDNVLSRENKSNFDLGIKSVLKFEDEVKKYCYMWKKGGEYSK